MTVRVQKYGGTSVGSPERLRAVAARIKAVRDGGEPVVAVVSAMGPTTDQLITLARQVSRDPSDRELDSLLSTGEQVSVALLAMALQDLGCDAVSLTGGQVGIHTDDRHRKARVLEVSPDRVRAELDQGRVVLVAGFQGVNEAGDVTTLGRGGSDTTAVALAAALGAGSCEIFTDVDGIFTADPRVVPGARKLDAVGYEEVLEMASLGAQVMQLQSVEYARRHGVTIHVRSSFHDQPGTIIQEASQVPNPQVITGVSYDPKVALITMAGVPDRPGVAYQVFSALAKNGINVDMITGQMPQATITNMSFTVHEDDLERAVALVEREADYLGAGGVSYDREVAKVSVVGSGIASHAGVAANMFGALADAGVNIELITCSEIKISCIVRQSLGPSAARAVHRRFRLQEAGKSAVS